MAFEKEKGGVEVLERMRGIVGVGHNRWIWSTDDGGRHSGIRPRESRRHIRCCIGAQAAAMCLMDRRWKVDMGGIGGP